MQKLLTCHAHGTGELGGAIGDKLDRFKVSGVQRIGTWIL